MPKREDAPYSEEVDIPFEIFQSYFEEKKRSTFQYKLTFGILLTLSVVLSAALIAGTIALPFLVPAISGFALAAYAGLVGTGVITLLVPGIFICSSWFLNLRFPPKESKAFLFDLLKNISFKRDAIEISLLNSSSCILTRKGEKTHIATNSNLEQNLSSKATQQNILLILEDVKNMLESKQGKLSQQKKEIVVSIDKNLKENIKELSILDKKLSTLDTELEKNAKNLQAVNKVIPDIIFESSVEEQYLNVVSKLSSFLKENKEYMRHFSLEETDAQKKIQGLRSEQLKCSGHVKEAIAKEIKKLQADLSAKKLNLKKELDTIMKSIQSSKTELYLKNQDSSVKQADFVKYAIRQIDNYLASASEMFLQIEPSLFLEYCPEQATRHYSSLLNNPATQIETLEFLNQILADYPQSDSQTNQSANYILANHFLSQLMIHKTEVLRAQACQAVLRLSSSNENNANLKEAILLYAFYKHKNLSKLPDDILYLVPYSDGIPEAYNKLKEQIEGTANQKTLHFSNHLEQSTNSEETDVAPSDSSLKVNKPP